MFFSVWNFTMLILHLKQIATSQIHYNEHNEEFKFAE